MAAMSAQRRLRLETVLIAITPLDEFSPQEAKQRCAEVSPQFVTQTLSQLAREGMLRRCDQDKQVRYRWSAAPETFQPALWIDRQIHAEQVTQTPVEERPRERLLRDGVASLSTADLLAILIRVGVRGESAVTAGRKLANRFAQSLQRLRSSSQAELKAISPALTVVSYSQIMAGIELGRRVAKAEGPQPEIQVRITSSAEATAYCAQRFADLAHDGVQEEFHIVTLDTKHKPIATHRITVGTLDASLVHPREVFRAAIRDAASAILLVHNHPSGDPTPSREDRQVTERLTDAGKLIGIQVLDHIVVARQRCLSLRDAN
jgi:DNA repair protein RadC